MEPRKRKRLLLIVASGAVILLALLLLVSPAEDEPVYEGRSLSEWVKFRGGFHRVANASGVSDPAGAIQFFGTNALPYLVDWIAYEPNRIQGNVLANSQYLPRWLKENQAYDRAILDKFARSYNAVSAFAELGSRAAPAIPDLTRLVHSTNIPSTTRSRALSALGYIGPEALPIVLGIVSNLTQPTDLWILYAVRELGPNAAQTIPVLLPQLQNTNSVVAVSIAQFLSHLPGDSELIARALGNCLDDSRWEVRAEAANSLLNLGSRAKPAVPALVKALGDTNASVRSNAAAAIRIINPDALPKEFHE